MGANTSIQWTNSSWNCLRGCSRVSEGCRFCYAESTAYRFSGEGLPYEGLAVLKNGHPSWTGKVEWVEKHWEDPLRWTKPRKIFVNSMSDLFHENVPDSWTDDVFAVMQHAQPKGHVFQILTKRPKRMLDYLLNPHLYLRLMDRVNYVRGRWPRIPVTPLSDPKTFPLKNVWLGVSVENQDAADNRIEWLLRTPAAVRFLSVEPMLGPVNLNWVGCECDNSDSWDGVIDCLGGFTWVEEWDTPDGSQRSIKKCQMVPRIDWVICGGESGHGARPMDPAWIRSLRDQCKDSNTKFFAKQMGSAYGEHKGKNLPDDLNIRQFPGETTA